jgi:uncharacterized protein
MPDTCHRLSIWCLLVVALAAGPAGASLPAQPVGRVSDFAGVMQPAARQRLEAVLAELDRKTTAELAVVTMRSVPDGDVETAAVELFEKWGIGKKDKDNGALILCAVDDRRIRIEVGYGLEGVLPDAKVGRIVDQQILPRFRAGDFAGGIEAGAVTISGVIAADAGVTLNVATPLPARGPARRQRPRSSLPALILLVIMALLFIRNPRLFLLWMAMGGGRHHGGFGGGGFGGGGLGGFGGGFGGGLSGGGGVTRGW